MNRRLLGATALSLVATLLTACGGGGGGDASSGTARVRMVNATRSHATLDLLNGSTKVVSASALDAASAYGSMDSGSSTLQVTDAGSTTTLAAVGPTLEKDVAYTLVAYESNGAVKSVWVAENSTAPASGTSTLRVFNVAPDAGSIDVYVAPATADFASLSPSFTQSAGTATQISGLSSFTPGAYKVRVTRAGDKSLVLLDMAALTLADQKVHALLLLPTPGGVLVDGGLLVEQGDYSAGRNPNARFRVVSGVPGGTFSVSAGSTALQTSAQSPLIGDYLPLPAASTGSWSASVNGAAVGVPSIGVAAGSDNTLLLYGPVGAAQLAVLGDDNHLPTTSGTSNLRLVNGIAGGQSLSMTIDFGSVASNVLPGQGSSYRPVTASTSMRLEISTPSSVAPISTQTGLSLPSGGVFTIFVLGDLSSPYVLIRKDR